MKLSRHSIAIIEAFSDGYRISDCGDVFKNGHPMKITKSSNGYMMFSFKSSVVGWQRISVSKFAGYQKFGDGALGEAVEIRHLNDIPTDNRLENLEIGSPSQNHLDIKPSIRKSIAIAAASKLRKLTAHEADLVREENKNGISLKRLALKYGISKTAASYIINRKTY